MTIDDGGPAFPQQFAIDTGGHAYCPAEFRTGFFGMSQRTLIAAMVLTGYRSNEGYEGSDDDYVAWAVGDADDLLAALAKETEDDSEPS